jgi:hypothetical protein
VDCGTSVAEELNERRRRRLRLRLRLRKKEEGEGGGRKSRVLSFQSAHTFGKQNLKDCMGLML